MTKTTVAAVIVRDTANEREVLLTERAGEPFKGQWCLPGGHIDEYESARPAIIREVREETGLTFHGQFLGYQDEIIPERKIHAVVLIFTGEATGVLAPDPGEVSAIQWFPLAMARMLPLAFLHNQILDAYAAGLGATEH